MAATDDARQRPQDVGNFVSEWFGHRVHPTVSPTAESLQDQRTERCPFLSAATRETRACIKSAAAKGICTISSCSNGPRQDWLVCPYRTLDPFLLQESARRLFAVSQGAEFLTLPAPALAKPELRRELSEAVTAGKLAIVYLQDKLGGEISLPKTERSPELALDITMVEITHRDGSFSLGRYGILEVQTMDFHGSYRYAVQNLRDALRLHGHEFPRVLQANQSWLSDHIEGPNIANVFKRTFYQMMLKFQIAAKEPCGGCVVAIPASVWDSWQRHLGKPELKNLSNGIYALDRPVGGSEESLERAVPSAWVLVFDTDPSSDVSPNPIRIEKIIETSAAAMSYYALEVAPQAAVAEGAASYALLESIRRRIRKYWRELAPSACPDESRP